MQECLQESCQHSFIPNGAAAGIAEGLTDCTLDLYCHVLEKLLPTPSRFHYIFTARDLSRIVEGLTLANPQVCTIGIQLLRQWRHECMKILHDKLICKEDKQVTRQNPPFFLRFQLLSP